MNLTYWEQAVNFLGTPEGMVVFLLAILVVGIVLVKPGVRWPILGFMLVSTMLGFKDDSMGMVDLSGPMPFPLGFLANHARLVTVFSAGSLLVAALTAARGWRPKTVGFGAMCFLLLYLWMAFRATMDEATLGRGVLGLISSVVFFAVLSVGLGRWLQTTADARALLRAIATGASLFVLANLYLLAVRPSSVTTTRFFGVTANPQFIGIDCAMFLPTVLVLIEMGSTSLRRRIVLWATAGFLIIFLLWTGSRTSMLGALVGVVVLYHWRVHRLLPIALVVGVAVYTATWFFPQSLSNVARFTSSLNTRSGSFEALWAAFSSNPVLGNGQAAHAESMYLSVLAGYGLVGAVPLLGLLLHTGSWALTAIRLRARLGAEARLVDVCLANLAIIPVIGLFEETLIGIFNPLSLFFYLNLSLLTFLVLAGRSPAEARGEAAASEIETLPAVEPAVAGAPGYG